MQGLLQSNAIGPYTIPGRFVYDISQNFLNPFPDLHCLEYLNTRAVQQAIGVPVNYTRTSLTTFCAFNATGGYARGGVLAGLASLLESGGCVALMYGTAGSPWKWQQMASLFHHKKGCGMWLSHTYHRAGA